jgi:hypothetical protein
MKVKRIASMSRSSPTKTTRPQPHLGHVRSRGMSRLSAVLIVYAALSATTGLANAGACAEQITQLRQAARLDHEPTPESVGQVQTYAQLMFAAALAEAEALDAEGNEAECLLAARRAKQMIEPG